jgi:RimJ/RimL family protein N-acetyltransferase
MIVIQSPRLRLSEFQMLDARDVFGCITPAIAKFMPWEPPSWSEYMARCEKRAQAPEPNKFSFVIRRLDNRECLGMASLEDADSVSPELGLWLKESAHEQGFGREVVTALVKWGHATLGKKSFIYPVAVQNTASRRIAENLHGEIIGNRKNPKYDSVVYRIPGARPIHSLPGSPSS